MRRSLCVLVGSSALILSSVATVATVSAAAAAAEGPAAPADYEAYLENPQMTGEGQRRR